MNKRVKRKLNKRIKHKLIDDLPLSEFEEKHYLKQWKKSFNRRKQKQKLRLAAYGDTERIDIIDAENYYLKYLFPIDHEEYQPTASKWQRVKDKLKGWFSK